MAQQRQNQNIVNAVIHDRPADPRTSYSLAPSPTWNSPLCHPLMAMWLSPYKGWHKHIKPSFGIKPRYINFYEHLKVQQGKTVALIRDIEKRLSKKKRKTKEKQYEEKI
ncbi:hypothetical protein DSO57_1002486 [Entomophthora muscae]|uniref:Uncharacterized protein n=1 Tax=Entomophthora muscae TaxID=34485 RepID=A0ACC2SLZ8_9FUNG|nr:hypothetical protein DSO57_1002486 [Entomophthora muscae]